MTARITAAALGLAVAATIGLGATLLFTLREEVFLRAGETLGILHGFPLLVVTAFPPDRRLASQIISGKRLGVL